MKILIAGDFCPKGYMTSEILESEHIQKTAKDIAKLTASHDISVVNVETVYSDYDIPIPKNGPNIKSSLISMEFLKAMNFTLAACANNHIGDYGEQGVLDTLAHLKALGLITMGAGANVKEASETCYIEKNGMKIAFINCCEHEFGIAKKDKAGTAALDFYDTGVQIREAKKNADAVIVYVHGGNETNPLPRPGMKKLCRHFAECGASAVIVGHAHCPQGVEVHQGVPIAYGLGNFFFYWETPKAGTWGKGYMVSLEVNKDGKASMELLPYTQHYETGVQILEGEEKEKALQYITHLSELMQDGELYEKLTLAWCKRCGDLFWTFDFGGTSPNPKEPKALSYRNRFTCESHCELARTYLEAYCDGLLDESLESYEDMLKKLQQGEIIDAEN